MTAQYSRTTATKARETVKKRAKPAGTMEKIMETISEEDGIREQTPDFLLRYRV